MENASPTASQNPGIGWPSVREIIVARIALRHSPRCQAASCGSSTTHSTPPPRRRQSPRTRPPMHFLRSLAPAHPAHPGARRHGRGRSAPGWCRRKRAPWQQQFIGFPDSDIASPRGPAAGARRAVFPARARRAGLCARRHAGPLHHPPVSRHLRASVFPRCSSSGCSSILSDNISDFRRLRRTSSPRSAPFTAAGCRRSCCCCCPTACLLALLYSLGKLSTNREIIAIIQSGRGILAHHPAVAHRRAVLSPSSAWVSTTTGRPSPRDARMKSSRKPAASKSPRPARCSTAIPTSRRLWMIGAFPAGLSERPAAAQRRGHHHRRRPAGSTSRLSASQRHSGTARSRRWTFENPVISRFEPGMPPEFEKPEEPLTIDSWPETPWQLIKPGLAAAYLGIPDLNTWLRANTSHPQFADPAPYLTQWHYRWALPFTCLVTVLLATPLAIHFSRRGPGGGIFLAVVLSALMLLLSTIVLAFGEAGTIHPVARRLAAQPRLRPARHLSLPPPHHRPPDLSHAPQNSMPDWRVTLQLSNPSHTSHPMALAESWHVRSRSRECAATRRPFTDGETIVTALFPDPESSGYLRRDYCLDAWNERPEDAEKPFSFWKTTFSRPVRKRNRGPGRETQPRGNPRPPRRGGRGPHREHPLHPRRHARAPETAARDRQPAHPQRHPPRLRTPQDRRGLSSSAIPTSRSTRWRPCRTRSSSCSKTTAACPNR